MEFAWTPIAARVVVVELLRTFAHLVDLPASWLVRFMDEVDEVWDLRDPFLTGDDVATPTTL